MAQPATKWDLLRQGVEAAKTGDKERARQLLRGAASENPEHETTWLWLATVSEHSVELESSLRKALSINPSNERARAWLLRVQAKRQAQSLRQHEGPPLPAAASPLKTTKWRCPICDQASTVRPERCARCRSILSVADPERFFDDNDVHRGLVRAAIERLESFGRTDDPADRYKILGLAYLNLGQLREALIHLRTAYDLRPEDPVLRRSIEGLRTHLESAPEECREEESSWDETGTAEIDLETILVANLAARRKLARKAAEVVEEERPVVLVVDDSPTVCKLVEVSLRHGGYRVELAADGMEALSKLRDSVPDLIMLDVSMPHLDGYKICKLVKQNDSTQHIPVVFLSGNDGFLDKVKGRMAGAVEYLTKPFDPDALTRIVGKHLQR